MKSPILVYPDPNTPYTLFTDASKYAWSAVLMQEHTFVIDGKTIHTNIQLPIESCRFLILFIFI